MNSESVLRPDGVTDGGCTSVTGVTLLDKTGDCLDAGAVKSSTWQEWCGAEVPPPQPPNYTLLFIVWGVTGGLVIFVAVGGYFIAHFIKNDAWIYGAELAPLA